MGPTLPIPTADYLRECFSYDPESGELYWIKRPRAHFSSDQRWRATNTRYAGKKAGGKLNRGYHTVRLNGIGYRAHRIIWCLVYGVDPGPIIDHRDRDGSNNRLSNLRIATHSENSINQRVRRDNTSGFPGVSYRDGTWRARIQINGQTRLIGRFKSKPDAIAARICACIELGRFDALPLAYRSDFEALVCDLAAKDVRAGKRTIPGFRVDEVKGSI